MKIKISMFTVFIVCIPIISLSASFNCNKAGTPTEKAICADAELSKMDEEMALIYKEFLSYSDSDTEKSQRLQTQRDWLKERNICGGNIQCLKFAYKYRIMQTYNIVKADELAYVSEDEDEDEVTQKAETDEPETDYSEAVSLDAKDIDGYIKDIKKMLGNKKKGKNKGKGKVKK